MRPSFASDAVLRVEGLAVDVGALVLLPHRIDVVGMDDAQPQVLVAAPFLAGVAEQRFGLRARVEVRGELVGPIDVEDRRDALDELSVVLGERAPELVAASAQTLEISPASRATRGTTLVRSSHSAGA